jgi:hypothetical protein
MPSRRPSTTIERLIAESKQITSDLIALRHEVERKDHRRRSIWGGGQADRMRLICDNARVLADDMHKLWSQEVGLGDDDSPITIEPPQKRALGNGQLYLTGGR